jgi:hypothetical protein
MLVADVGWIAHLGRFKMGIKRSQTWVTSFLGDGGRGEVQPVKPPNTTDTTKLKDVGNTRLQ